MVRSVLVPLMYTEFVEVKHYLTRPEFLSGYALQQALPGPTFSFTSFLGGMSMANKGGASRGQIAGSVVAVIGINTPGLILILFIVPIFNDLKKITRIYYSLSGLKRGCGYFMITKALILLARPFGLNWLAYLIMGITFLLLYFTKIKTPVIIVIGVVLGLVF